MTLFLDDLHDILVIQSVLLADLLWLVLHWRAPYERTVTTKAVSYWQAHYTADHYTSALWQQKQRAIDKHITLPLYERTVTTYNTMSSWQAHDIDEPHTSALSVWMRYALSLPRVVFSLRSPEKTSVKWVMMSDVCDWLFELFDDALVDFVAEVLKRRAIVTQHDRRVVVRQLTLRFRVTAITAVTQLKHVANQNIQQQNFMPRWLHDYSTPSQDGNDAIHVPSFHVVP